MLGAKIHILLASQISNHNNEDTFPHKMNVELHKRENKFLFQEKRRIAKSILRKGQLFPYQDFKRN